MKLVCLGFASHLRIFHSFGDVTITDEGLQILVYTQHSWPLSSEGSLARHTYCDTGHLFMWSSLHEDPQYSHLLPNNWQWSCHYLFSMTYLSRRRIEPWSPSCEANAVQNEPLMCLPRILSLIFIHILHILFSSSFPSKEKSPPVPKKLKQIQ